LTRADKKTRKGEPEYVLVETIGSIHLTEGKCAAPVAADLVRSGQFGMMSALVGNQIVGVPLAKATGELKTVS